MRLEREGEINESISESVSVFLASLASSVRESSFGVPDLPSGVAGDDPGSIEAAPEAGGLEPLHHSISSSPFHAMGTSRLNPISSGVPWPLQ